MHPLEAEITAEERDGILDRIAREVTRRRMEVPAILALELHRPLSFLGSQTLVVFTPMLAPAFGLQNMQKAARLLEDRGNIDRLIERIEEMADAQKETGTPEVNAGSDEGGKSDE
jgi:hypothetical protein